MICLHCHISFLEEFVFKLWNHVECWTISFELSVTWSERNCSKVLYRVDFSVSNCCYSGGSDDGKVFDDSKKRHGSNALVLRTSNWSERANKSEFIVIQVPNFVISFRGCGISHSAQRLCKFMKNEWKFHLLLTMTTSREYLVSGNTTLKVI